MPYAMSDGVRIRYEVEGAGSPLVLHCGGLGCSLDDWYESGFVDELREDYRLILIDPRGQGQSDKPHDPAMYDYQQRAADVVAVLDALGVERTTLWGYSLGVRVGFALGVHAPGRVVALILGGASPDRYEGPRGDDDPVIQGLQRGMAAAVADWEAGSDEFWISEAERQRWLAADAEAIIASWTRGTAHPGFVDALPSISIPALLYCGSEDDPDPVRRAAQAMPDATFVELVGLDHAAGYARHELVLPHVEPFLERVTRASAGV